MIRKLNQTEAVQFLLEENVVALPTETVYGLAGLADSKNAVNTIFRLKNRPLDNPLICHFYSLSQVLKYAKVEYDYLFEMLNYFWPGGLTVLLPINKSPKNKSAKSTNNSQILSKSDLSIDLNRGLKGDPNSDSNTNNDTNTSLVDDSNLDQNKNEPLVGGYSEVDSANDQSQYILSPATLGQDRVGCRVPDNQIFLEIIKSLDRPLAAPSANLSTRPSCTSADQVIAQFGELFENPQSKNFEMGVVEGDQSRIGLESTIILPLEKQISILRPGWIGKVEIEEFLKKHSFDIEVIEKAKSSQTVPGAKYKHYSPKTKILKFYKDQSQETVALDTFIAKICSTVFECLKSGEDRERGSRSESGEKSGKGLNSPDNSLTNSKRAIKIGIWNMIDWSGMRVQGVDSSELIADLIVELGRKNDFGNAPKNVTSISKGPNKRTNGGDNSNLNSNSNSNNFKFLPNLLSDVLSPYLSKNISKKSNKNYRIDCVEIFQNYNLKNPEELSQNFYKSLNQIDADGFDLVIMILPSYIQNSNDSKIQALNNKIEKL